MTPGALALLLRRRDRRLRALQLRMDAACERIRKLADANVRLRETSAGLVRLLAAISGGGDPEASSHGERTARIAVSLARRMKLSAAAVDDLRLAAMLHDVARHDLEMDTDVLGHAERGARLLEGLSLPPGVAMAVRCHHDRFDGRGNRTGLSGHGIPKVARILAVADSYDELVSGDGPGVLQPGDAARAMRATSGRVHDPDVVAALCAMVDEDGESRRSAGARELIGAGA